MVFVQSTTHIDLSLVDLDVDEKKERKLSELMKTPFMFPNASPILPDNYTVLRNISDCINYKNLVIYISIEGIYIPLILLDLKGVVYIFSDNIITSFPTLKKLVDEGKVFVPPLRYGSPRRGSVVERKSPPRSPRSGKKSPPKSPKTSGAGAGKKSPPKSPKTSGAGAGKKSPRK
jgi:hypothetical protein